MTYHTSYPAGYTPSGDYLLDWTLTGADGSATLTSSAGSGTVGVTVSTPTSASGDSFTLSGGLLKSDDVSKPTQTVVEFDQAVTDLNFQLKDVDQGWGWDDKVTVLAYDADGNLVDVEFTSLQSGQQVTGNTIEGGRELCEEGVTVTVSEPIVKLVVIHDNGSSAGESGHISITDMGFNCVPAPEGDGIVEGTAGDDLIDLAYTGDPDGDMVDNNDELLPGEGPNDDIIVAGAGDDQVYAGAADDEVYAGAGNDYVEGGAGDDVIYGDSDGPYGAGAPGEAKTLVWDNVASDGTKLGSSTDYDAGGINVNIGFVAQDYCATATISNDQTYVEPGEGFDADSSLMLHGLGGEGGWDNTSTTTLSFSSTDDAYGDEVQNVAFRLNDVDVGNYHDNHIDRVTIRAYDAEGNAVAVVLTPTGVQNVSGNTVTGTSPDNGYQGPEDAIGSVEVAIAGPVARIEIDYDNGANTDQAIWVSDITFDTTGTGGSGEPGDDTLLGGEGDDLIFGEGGDDTITGGDGADTMHGGADRDTFIGGTAGDAVDGGSEGDDYDVLDLSGSGPLRIVDQTTDPDGNSTSGIVQFLDDSGNVTGEMTFTEIEQIILPPNSGPNAEDDTATTDEDTAVTIDVLGNDTDPDGDPLTVTEATSPDGDVVINPDGTITFTPDENFNGTTEITYTVDDGNGGTDTATVTVEVTPVNDAPVAEDDTATTDEDTAVTIDVLGNDTDPDGDPLTVTEATSPDGDVVINPDGTITFTPDENFNGTTEITYTVDDGNGGTDTATVTVEVTPVNDDPDAVDDTASTDENTTVTVDLLGNDSDVDGDTLEIVDISDPANGTIVDNGDGTVDYIPDPGFSGTDSFTYTVSDGNGGTDTATVTVNVNNVNDAPVAEDDTASTHLDTAVTIAVLDNDSDPDGDPLIVTEATSPDGDVAINPDGTITFTPAAGFDGEAVVNYTISDGNGGTDSATVTILVNDGIVEGTAGDDLIDYGYAGDPEGDMVDHNDEFLPGEGPNDDIIEAYEGDDTVYAGLGDDEVDAGEGDDTVYGEEGNDTIIGGDGSDTVYGGDGDDYIDTSGSNPMTDYGFPPILPQDTDMFDDRDYVEGGDGNDTIITGDDQDVILGGAGDDTIDGGLDDDTIDGGEGDDYIIGGHGSDTIEGGDGDDEIWGGLGPDTDPLNIVDALDPRPDNGIDVIHGGAGNDVIYGQDDDDVLYGDAGDDYIDGGIDNDTIYGGDGLDTLIGGQGDDLIYGGDGADTIDGGEGDDVIYAGQGKDVVHGGAGDDYIDGETGEDILYGDEGDDTIIGTTGADQLYGGDGDDTITGGNNDDYIEGGDGDDVIDAGADNDEVYGGAGDDEIAGGTGDDTIDGGAGNDVIDGGEGNDTLSGGDDRDLFVNVNYGDYVDGNEGGDDWDTLDLTGSAPSNGSLKVTFTTPNEENGYVTYFDKDGNDLGTLDFYNIEKVIPCFTPGTMIATPKGERRVEELEPGDRVITRDNGIQEIKWVGHKPITFKELAAADHLKPVLIKAGALGNGLPERDMMVSPNHRVLVANDRTTLYFDEREVLAAAKHLVDNQGIQVVEPLGVTYVHFMFERHEVVLSDGAWTESFQPGDYSLKGIGNAQRQELFELFPELETAEGLEDYASARRVLKKHEARMLVK
ncbi:Ig-like domain-containing protein [Sinisalibacter aestuarii]|uniref:Hint domain-containing protein n=1 Tax=Sinisalibacter aestuarii TaxID=2949426 RepID=A0ABQ5LVG5_9RHOB|nr:tandem-95 repeat protein [Sinisalibacter aestuarii]GKY88985.1 hypothetical protein STA1M1_28540 [Sinisalibacter aestuarii]